MTQDPPAKNVVQQGTGEKLGTLAWMAVGAAVGAALLAPAIMRFLGISYEFAIILGGVALALVSGALAKALKGRMDGAFGSAKRIGNGAAVFGVGLFGAKLLAPLLRKLPWIGKITGGGGEPSNIDPAFIGLAAA